MSYHRLRLDGNHTTQGPMTNFWNNQADQKGCPNHYVCSLCRRYIEWQTDELAEKGIAASCPQNVRKRNRQQDLRESQQCQWEGSFMCMYRCSIRISRSLSLDDMYLAINSQACPIDVCISVTQTAASSLPTNHFT